MYHSYKKAIVYLKKAIRIEKDESDYSCLAFAQSSLLELSYLDRDFSHPKAKEKLREEAIDSYRKYYEMSEDKRAIEAIQSLEAIQI